MFWVFECWDIYTIVNLFEMKFPVMMFWKLYQFWLSFDPKWLNLNLSEIVISNCVSWWTELSQLLGGSLTRVGDPDALSEAVDVAGRWLVTVTCHCQTLPDATILTVVVRW